MSVVEFIAAQLRKPSGWFGSLVVARLMNIANRKLTDHTIELLDVRPEHQVLEIGFGGSYGLARLLGMVENGTVIGLDCSADMIRKAERRFVRDLEQGRLKLQLGNVARLPFADGTFDCVLTANTIYFWPDTAQGLAEIRRVLKPQGRAAIAIRSREKMGRYSVTQHNFRLFSKNELAGLMNEAGFRNIHVEERDQDKTYDEVIAVGNR